MVVGINFITSILKKLANEKLTISSTAPEKRRAYEDKTADIELPCTASIGGQKQSFVNSSIIAAAL